jgi:hypothetical protein
MNKTLINQYVELVRSRFMHQNVAIADSLILQASKVISELRDKYDIVGGQ